MTIKINVGCEIAENMFVIFVSCNCSTPFLKNYVFLSFVQMITMKLRRPYTTASMWSSGKVTCTGATSEEQAKIAARRFARCLQKLGFEARFTNFRVVNVLGTCSMPFAIKITAFSERYKENAE